MSCCWKHGIPFCSWIMAWLMGQCPDTSLGPVLWHNSWFNFMTWLVVQCGMTLGPVSWHGSLFNIMTWLLVQCYGRTLVCCYDMTLGTTLWLFFLGPVFFFFLDYLSFGPFWIKNPQLFLATTPYSSNWWCSHLSLGRFTQGLLWR